MKRTPLLPGLLAPLLRAAMPAQAEDIAVAVAANFRAPMKLIAA
jgi:hypothetical protein